MAKRYKDMTPRERTDAAKRLKAFVEAPKRYILYQKAPTARTGVAIKRFRSIPDIRDYIEQQTIDGVYPEGTYLYIRHESGGFTEIEGFQVFRGKAFPIYSRTRRSLKLPQYIPVRKLT